MKKLFCFFSILLMFLSSNVYAESFKVKIDNKDVNVSKVVVEINEKELNTKFDSYTLSGRTFVPIREITESLGAKVDWDNKTRSATVSMENKQVKLQIDSDIVYVDGKKTNIQENSIPKFAVYLNPKREVKTMVPLRFLSETFGYEVGWNGDKYIASVITKKEEKKVESASIDFSEKEIVKYENKSESKKEEVKKVISKKIKSDGLVTILLDAGHGGSDSGAVSVDGKTKEKELTLEITKKLNDKLLENGYDVHMTRETDKAVDLYKRPEIANDLGAEIFLSIHINSSENSEPSGIEVFYAPALSNKLKEVEQSPLAESLQKSLIKETGAISRGAKAGGRLVVLKNTKNVAALAELGFISNKKELDLMKDEDYQEKLVNGLYNGLIDYIDNYVE